MDQSHPAGDRIALLIIDMINDLEFDSARSILDQAEAVSHKILEVKAAARRAGAPIIYVNDNFGRWSDDRRQITDWASRPGARGGGIARRLAPDDDDIFVVKPQHSGFYGTNLQVLLPSLAATRLILVGMAADLCVLFTAADAHMRQYRLFTPGDCLVPSKPDRLTCALDILRDGLDADVRPSEEQIAELWR
jgi:nicotinamidase-related amidase